MPAKGPAIDGTIRFQHPRQHQSADRDEQTAVHGQHGTTDAAGDDDHPARRIGPPDAVASASATTPPTLFTTMTTSPMNTAGALRVRANSSG